MTLLEEAEHIQGRIREPEELEPFVIGLAVGVSAGGILGAAVALAVTGWFG